MKLGPVDRLHEQPSLRPFLRSAWIGMDALNALILSLNLSGQKVASKMAASVNHLYCTEQSPTFLIRVPLLEGDVSPKETSVLCSVVTTSSLLVLSVSLVPRTGNAVAMSS